MKVLLIFIAGCAAGWFAHQVWWQERSPHAVSISEVETGRAPFGHIEQGESELPRLSSRNSLADLLVGGDFDAALDRFTAAQRAGNEGEANRLREQLMSHALALQDQGDFDAAAHLLEEYLGTEYRDIQALELQASVRFERKKYVEAINTLFTARSYAYTPEDLDRINRRIDAMVSQYATLLHDSKATRGLLSLYQKLTQLQPDYSPYFIELARAQLALGETTEARQSLGLVVHDPMVSEQATQLLDSLREDEAEPVEYPASTIPLIARGDQYLVEAWLNDRGMVTLLLDTGASMTVIKPSALDREGVQAGISSQSRWFQTANGSVEAPVMVLDSLTLGDKQVVGIEVAGIELADMPTVDGLLGMNFLRHFQFFIDQTDGVLRLTLNP